MAFETLGSATLKETVVASASTCNIGVTTTLRVNITGTTTISSFGTAPNKLRHIRFSGILTLTHNATSLVLPAAANIATAAGDTAIAASDASGNWRVTEYQRASGLSISSDPTKVDKTGDTMSGALTAQYLTATVGIQVTVSSVVSAGASLNMGYVSPYGIALRPSTDTGAVPIVFTNAASSICGQISTTATTTAYATSSDDRLKEDLKSFDAGRIVDDTNVYDFSWKSTGKRAYGVIGQQANEVYPEAVIYDEQQDWWGVDYSKYVPVLLQELKALRARVAELEGRVAITPTGPGR